jgi:hypothetical protein
MEMMALAIERAIERSPDRRGAPQPGRFGEQPMAEGRGLQFIFLFPFLEGERRQEQMVKEAFALFAHNLQIIGGSNKSFDDRIKDIYQ